MRKTWIPCLTLSLFILICMVPATARAGDWTGNVNFLLGQKQMDKNDWEPVEDQSEFGAEVTWGKEDWPIQIATDVFSSSDDQSGVDPLVGAFDLEVKTSELGIGVRKVWEKKKVRPYVGGGLAYVGVSIDANTEVLGTGSADDSALGAWAGGGIFWRLGPRFNLGFAARFSKATVTSADLEGGGTHAGLILGWGWPASK